MNNTKTLTAKEKINFFKKELSMIQNETIRRIVEKALANVDDRFFFAPASSTGNYHPWWACVVHGLVYHTRMVAFLAVINCDRFRNFAEDAAIDKDIVIAAAILHDSCKKNLRCDFYPYGRIHNIKKIEGIIAFVACTAQAGRAA